VDTRQRIVAELRKHRLDEALVLGRSLGMGTVANDVVGHTSKTAGEPERMRATFAMQPRLAFMKLINKTAVIYGAGGAVGTALAKAFAQAGATVALTGRHREPLETLAQELGGGATAVQVDALDEVAIEKHLATMGRVDVSVNAIGIPQTGVQGIPLAQLSAEAYMAPVVTYVRSHFLTARAAARRMVAQNSGVIIAHTANPARVAIPLMGGMTPAWAALEVMMGTFSVEHAAKGVRALVLRTTGLPETGTIDEVYGLHARAMGVTREQFQQMLESRTHRGRHNVLAELAAAAVFVASDAGSGFTGTTLDLTGGMTGD
jgi:NAD(P)-dependent dehydrogenase (short-subunit alcohol dehydrogenase family)